MNFSRIATAAAYSPLVPQGESTSTESSFSEWGNRAWAQEGKVVSEKALGSLETAPTPSEPTAFWNQWPDKAWSQEI